jgi:hypothetical protein
MSDTTVRCEQTLFAEKVEFSRLIKQCEIETSLPSLTAAVKRIEEILSKYQEQASLLDAHLSGMVLPIMHRIRTELIEKYTSDVQLREVSADGAAPAAAPDNPVLHKLFQVVYLISKTRGYKHIVRLLPHEVADLEPALQMLVSQSRDAHESWETRYVLFLWLSILVLVPFDLHTADSLVSKPSDSGPGCEQTYRRDT